jgi:hypothetical protein
MFSNHNTAYTPRRNPAAATQLAFFLLMLTTKTLSSAYEFDYKLTKSKKCTRGKRGSIYNGKCTLVSNGKSVDIQLDGNNNNRYKWEECVEQGAKQVVIKELSTATIVTHRRSKNGKKGRKKTCNIKRSPDPASTEVGKGATLELCGGIPRVEVDTDGLVEDGETLDATVRIRNAIEQARTRAETSFPQSKCLVPVFLPKGVYHVHREVKVLPRTYLIGAGSKKTKIYKVLDKGHKYAALQLGSNLCSDTGYMGVRDLAIELRDTFSEKGRKDGYGVHCIRSGHGLVNFEVKNVELSDCGFYGIGLQHKECLFPYKDFTLSEIRIDNTESDGLDIKPPRNPNDPLDPTIETNSNGRLENIYITNSGKSAVDLSGTRMLIYGLVAIKNDGGVATGIDLGFEVDRNTQDTQIENVSLEGFSVAIEAGSQYVKNIAMKNTKLTNNYRGLFWQSNAFSSIDRCCAIGNDINAEEKLYDDNNNYVGREVGPPADLNEDSCDSVLGILRPVTPMEEPSAVSTIGLDSRVANRVPNAGSTFNPTLVSPSPSEQPSSQGPSTLASEVPSQGPSAGPSVSPTFAAILI